jgi:hypothetical protein
LDVPAAVAEMIAVDFTARGLAEGLLDRALALDDGRPRDDISILAMRVEPEARSDVRRLSVRVPIR